MSDAGRRGSGGGGAGGGPAGGGSVELTRDLGFWDVTLIGVGAMIGAGIFVLVGSAAGRAGPALLLAFVLNGIVALLTALVYAELGSAMPSAGGSYVFIRQALPGPFSFLAGSMSWFAHSVAGSLYALGFGSFLVEILRVGGLDLSAAGFMAALPHNAPELAFGVAIALVFFFINFRGASETGAAGRFVTMAKVLVIFLFVGGGLLVLLHNPERLAAFKPFAPNGLAGVFLAMGITYVAFEGFEVIVQAGEEVKDPKRTIPKAVVTAMIIVIPTYLLVSIALLGAIDPPPGEPSTWQWLGDVKELGLARAAAQVMPYGNIVILLGGLLSTMSALNATTFSATRVSFAMGRDRFLPGFFSRIHPERRTPHLALAGSGALILFMLVALPLEGVAASASLMFLLLFFMVNASSVFIRWRYGDRMAYGYVTPFFPAVPLLAIAIQAVIASQMLHFSTGVLLTAVGWLAAGGAVYFLYSRRRVRDLEPVPVVVAERTVLETSGKPPVVLPIARPYGVEGLVRTAAGIARSLDRHVLLLHVVTVPEQLPISAGLRLVEEGREEVRGVARMLRDLGVEVELVVRLAHRPATAIIRTIETRRADFCVLGWRGHTRGRNRVLGSNLDAILRQANSNFVVIQNVDRPVRRVLFPASNPLQAQVAFAVGYGLSRAMDAEVIDVVTIFPEDTHRDTVEERVLEMAHAVGEAAGVELDAWEEPVELDGLTVHFRAEYSNAPVDRIRAMSQGYDLLVLGAGPGGIGGRHVLGKVTWTLAQSAHCPTVAVKRRTGGLHFQVQSFFEFFRDQAQAPAETKEAGRRAGKADAPVPAEPPAEGED